MDKSVAKNLTAPEKWLRFLFMIFFFVINYFVQILIGFLALFQFIYTLIKNEPNERVVHFGDSLSQFVYQTMAYLTYSSELKPFPFSEWPTPRPVVIVEKKVTVKKVSEKDKNFKE